MFERVAEISKNPEFVKGFFYWMQILLIMLIAVYFLFLKGSGEKSQFKLREADRPENERRKGADALAHARMQTSGPLQLEGIRLDQPPHIILGVTPDASHEQIQKAYRELMKRYHPDQVGRPGTREWQDAQKIAEAINRAKESILKNRR